MTSPSSGFEHGTAIGYNHGCRCDACREEASARRREAYRARMRSLGKPPRKAKKWAKPMRTEAGNLLLYDSDGNVLGALRSDGAAAVIMGRYYEVPMA